MGLTMNAVTSIGNRAVLTVVSHVWDVGKSLPFDRDYVPADSYGNRLLYPGLVVGQSDDQSMYVPYNAASSYGAYSAYAVGVLYHLYDFTFEAQIVAPATRATAVEQYCWIFGSTMGSIADAVKEAVGMKLIQWD